MKQVSIKRYRARPIMFLILLLGAFCYSSSSQANTSPIAGQQLAYLIGYHSSPGYVYYGPQYSQRHYNKFYWTGWRYVARGCQKNCLVNRWNGRIIRCNSVCRH